MNKLSEQEIEKRLDDEENVAIYRMFTPLGVHLHMKIADFYYHHYGILTHIIIQIPLLIVDIIDGIEYSIKYKKSNK